MDRVQFIDTTLRDGQQSMWASGMRTAMMLPALPDIDRAGFEAIEFFVPSIQLKKLSREFRDNPWHWVKLGAKSVQDPSRLRLHSGYTSYIQEIPKCIGKLMLKIVADYGITEVRESNYWNDFKDNNLIEEIEEFHKLGMSVIINLAYSVSPRHTDEYFISRAKDAVALKPYRICLKDVGGIMTPERVRELVPKIQSAIGDIPLEFHAHCSNGLAPFNVLEAVQSGIRHVHTAIPPLANGSSQPSIFNAVRNVRALGYETDVDLTALKAVEEHFTNIANRENLPIGVPLEYDQTQYHHQVPGGMISNLRFQLEKVGMGNGLEQALEEAVRVRADFGYPIMITPLSQYVGTQAAINVMVGERYKEVSDDVIRLALGQRGEEATRVMDPDVRAKILNRPRAEELSRLSAFDDMSIEEARRKYGKNLTDEELILEASAGEGAVDIARQAPFPQSYPYPYSLQHPLVRLTQKLIQITNKSYISVQKGDFSLEVKKVQQ
jgi:oxaloacetate decarboxylase alpha subunit